MEQQIIRDEANQQFQYPIKDTNDIAVIDYRMRDDTMYLVHSEVPLKYRGQGIGRKLVVATKNYLDAHQIHAIPTCGYIRHVMSRLERDENKAKVDAQ